MIIANARRYFSMALPNDTCSLLEYSARCAMLAPIKKSPRREPNETKVKKYR